MWLTCFRQVIRNRYFLDNPEMVLGNWTRKDNLYGGGTKTRPCCKLNVGNLSRNLLPQLWLSKRGLALPHLAVASTSPG